MCVFAVQHMSVKHRNIKVGIQSTYYSNKTACKGDVIYLILLKLSFKIIILLRAPNSMNELLSSSGHGDLENTINLLHLIVSLYVSLCHA